MRYVLVDRVDNIVDKVDIDGGLNEAKQFFIKRKQIDEKEFNNIWKVKSEEDYDLQFKSSLQNRQVEWWKEEESYLDLDAPITQSGEYEKK